MRSGQQLPTAKCVQTADHLMVKATRDALVNSGGIGEAIGKDDRATIERGLDDFPDELAAAGFEKEQLCFRRHRHAFRGKLEEVADFFADRAFRPARA